MPIFDPEGMQRVYATKIEPEEILYVVKEMARLHQKGAEPDFYSAFFILAERYKGAEEGSVKSFCIIERMRCLARLMEKKDARMRGWSLEGIEEGCMFTNAAVFTATAVCPIRRQDSFTCYFDPDEFFEIVLRECDAEGRS